MRFIGVIQDPAPSPRFCVLMPWMKNGNIVEYVKKTPEASQKHLLEQVADGLDFMHQYNVVHGDLKGANVLIDDKGNARISDLGQSSIQEHIEHPPSVLGFCAERVQPYVKPLVCRDFGMDGPGEFCAFLLWFNKRKRTTSTPTIPRD
ncbi:hypothetical protein DXG03_004775 [Asterophora parasitica]|uniref:Protein kinase domain-containing protein n=1 Tax=Asterophora parasitica TaxID=117018 RepID=A0A9P7G6U0_9AGAR|nr:hypothetical protein DXG03_004775 [Asterophora parasitica]